MGDCLFSQEIIEHILQYADGETLLICRNISPCFKAAVKCLSKTKNIWKQCYFNEKGPGCPYAMISKLHPHKEGFIHTTNWDVLYESSWFIKNSGFRDDFTFSKIELGKNYSNIQNIQTHGDLVLVLIKYNKDFSIFYRILTIDTDNVIINKSSRFHADKLYVTPIEDSSLLRRDAIQLSCNYCKLVAIPVDVDSSIEGFPKFKQNITYLTVENSKEEVFWLNNCNGLSTKGDCFYIGLNGKLEEIKLNYSRLVKVIHRFTVLYISLGSTLKEFNTFEAFRSNVSASVYYSGLLVLGTTTGTLFLYRLNNESDLENLNLKCYISKFDISQNAILGIEVMDLENDFVIVCCSDKLLYRICLKRVFNV